MTPPQPKRPRPVAWASAACAALLTVLAGCGPVPEGEPGTAAAKLTSSSTASERLDALVEDYYDQYLALNPIVATSRGDHRFDADLGDYISPTWMANSLGIEQESLEKLQKIDPAKLKGEDRITYDVFEFGLRSRIERFRYPDELLPFNQVFSIPTQFVVLGSGQGVHPFRTLQDYDNFLSRMDGLVAWVDQAINNLRSGVAKGVVLPQVVVERTLPQLEAIAVDDPTKSPLWRPLLSLPASLSVADRQRLLKAYREKLTTQVFPAYRRLHDYLKNDYLPEARDSVGFSGLPNGASWYAYLVRAYTTTSLTPDEVHELGLKEVARIRTQMQGLAAQLGHQGELRTLFDLLRVDERFQYSDPDALLADYRTLKARVNAALPAQFSRIPRADFEIRPVEAFHARAFPAAAYQPASPDGSRPGVFYVNTHDLPSRPKYQMEAVFLHEAVPGHHFQNSFAMELEGLPRLRRFELQPAYAEGWALYAESLGGALGVYTDPYSRFGAASTELWRAARLVVDTGLHAKGWSREKAIEYMRANTASGEQDIVAEVERYIGMPGQALAYKVGEIRIRDLRRRAEQELGAKFDVRAFHEQVLDSGPLPLAVIEAKIDRWIAANQ
jgi:uncharacterized protein (DUF885 family)